LTKSYLTEPVNNTSILFVQEEYLNFLSNTYYLSKIYPLAKQMYSDIISLHLSSLSFYDLIKDNKIQFESVQVNL
jgi:hypothetical protein